MNIEIPTASYGTIPVSLGKHAVKYSIGGIWPSGLMQVAVYTRANEEAGYIINLNVRSGKKTGLERLKCTYISGESRKKYGNKCITEFLPIL